MGRNFVEEQECDENELRHPHDYYFGMGSSSRVVLSFAFDVIELDMFFGCESGGKWRTHHFYCRVDIFSRRRYCSITMLSKIKGPITSEIFRRGQRGQ